MADRDAEPVADPIRARMMAEVEQIAATPEFVRAPTMQRLLNFLVAETLSGRGDQLKAYAVAVDGLGRPADFDARSDSYPRVQVGRLRKLLDCHYRLHPAPDGLRLHIPQGGYRVSVEEAASLRAQAPVCPRKGGWRLPHFVAAAMLLAILLALAWFMGQRLMQDSIVQPPVLRLTAISSPGVDPGRQESIRATLLDSLRRSDMFQITTDPRGPGASDPAPVQPRYVLSFDLTPGLTPTLFLQLWRSAPDRLLWSEKLILPEDAARDAEVMAPLVAAIAQPLGAVATAERVEWRGKLRPGYPCMLLFHQYRAGRDSVRQAELEECVQQTLKLDPGDAQALAAASTLAMDEALFESPATTGANAGPSPRARSLLLARKAVTTDPFSALTNQVMAQASMFAHSCAAAIRYGVRAAELNPYDPSILTEVGIYLVNCADPRGEEFARRAVLLDPNTPRNYALFVYLAALRGDGPAARAAAARMEQPIPGVRSFYYLTKAIALAADTDIAGARRTWEALRREYPEIARDPDALLRRWQFAPGIRTKSVGLLVQAGLVPPPQPTALRNATQLGSAR